MMLFLACVLTVLLEVPFLALFGYRSREDITITVCTNTVTNLLLNVCIQLVFSGRPGAWIWLLEGLVILSEYAVYALAFGRSARLALLTLAANGLSYGIGCLIF